MGLSRLKKVCAATQVSLVGAFCLNACSSGDALNFSEKLTFTMVGTYIAAEGASGNSDPRFIKVTLVGVSLTKEDGSTVALYEDEPKLFRIINRPQILHEVDMSPYVGQTLSSLTLNFEPSITGGGRVEDAMESSLMTSTVSYQQAYKVEKAIQKRLEVQLLWKNSVALDESVKPNTETLGQPGIALEFENE